MKRFRPAVTKRLSLWYFRTTPLEHLQLIAAIIFHTSPFRPLN